MGVGFAVDLVICSALGVDMFDCVFPTRTAVSCVNIIFLLTACFKCYFVEIWLRPINDWPNQHKKEKIRFRYGPYRSDLFLLHLPKLYQSLLAWNC